MATSEYKIVLALVGDGGVNKYFNAENRTWLDSPEYASDYSRLSYLAREYELELLKERYFGNHLNLVFKKVVVINDWNVEIEAPTMTPVVPTWAFILVLIFLIGFVGILSWLTWYAFTNIPFNFSLF